MKLFTTVLVFVAALVLSGSASGQTPATPAAAKIGLVNTAAFSNPNGGITRLVSALRTLDIEFKPRRDEIAGLVTRLETLGRLPANSPERQVAAAREQAETLQTEIRRKQEDARLAYTKRFATLTDPIFKSIQDALQAFGRARGFDALVDVTKFQDGILLLNPTADITPAFIRDYNSKNP